MRVRDVERGLRTRYEDAHLVDHGLLLGTVGQRVAARTDSALMLVHGDPEARSRRWPEPVERIHLAVARNEQCEQAVRAARELARQHRAEIVVQYVDPVYESASWARRFVRDLVRRLRTEGVTARTAGPTGVGEVASQIAADADRVDADVIVIGSRRRGDLAALVLGSVTRDLVRRRGLEVDVRPGG